MGKTETKNDIAWEKLFVKYSIPKTIKSKGVFEIKASTINIFREARLMTKFDYKSQLPKVFVKNNLSILPISRGNYVISNFETFKDFESNESPIIKIDFPNYLESLNFNKITSESSALNCAYVSGMIEDFVQDEDLKPTVNGRMHSSTFNFNINTKKEPLNIEVINSQIEIDGGYEGIDSLNLIEAKNSISNDFLIRQLYYPFKLWDSRINKKVRNLFLTYSNGVFHFREYFFDDPNHYNSLRLIKEKKYAIQDGTINIEVIQKILGQVNVLKEPYNIPFPQADSFERVINLCELLVQNIELNREYITNNYDFDVRQTNYYTDAGRYLGLIGKKQIDGEIIYSLTDKGHGLFKLPIFKRQLEYIGIILSHSAFNETLKLYFRKGESPSNNEIVAIMKSSNLFNLGSESTFKRRASTISSWVNWILDQAEV